MEPRLLPGFLHCISYMYKYKYKYKCKYNPFGEIPNDKSQIPAFCLQINASKYKCKLKYKLIDGGGSTVVLCRAIQHLLSSTISIVE